MLLDVILLIAVVALGGTVVVLVQRKRSTDAATAADARSREALDTVTGWPPEATRLLTGGERAAQEILAKALPECLLYAQVPLARFIKVPRRNSYTEWLTRVGHLCADLVICDRATQVLAVVLLQAARESERAERRRIRMSRVLKAAGVKVFIWREVALPSPETARDQITQRLGDAPPRTSSDQEGRPPARPGKIPVPEVVAELADPGPRLEPPASTWFDDLDSGRVPLDAERRNDKPRP